MLFKADRLSFKTIQEHVRETLRVRQQAEIRYKALQGSWKGMLVMKIAVFHIILKLLFYIGRDFL